MGRKFHRIADHNSFRTTIDARVMGDSFDLIRVVAASMVLWSHQYAVTGILEPVAPLLQNSLGNIGVAAFFALSGYLNAKSLLKRQSPLRFLAARALRIYPALIVSIIVTALYCAFAQHHGYAESRRTLALTLLR